ncbi:HIR complex subunit [Homalodisca vitripennis]|nr:HIR complex subunit [Homalodisca vitripennis]
MNGFQFCFPEVTLRTRKNRPTRPKWFTPELKVMRERLMSYRDFAKSTGSLDAKKVYSAARKTYQYEIRQAKLKTNAAYIEGAANKCSAAWKVIRQEKLGTNITKVSVTPDKFNDYFLSVAEEALKNVQAAPFNPIDMARRANAPVEDMRWTPITVDQILHTVGRMKDSKSKDIYSLSNSLIKSVVGIPRLNSEHHVRLHIVYAAPRRSPLPDNSSVTVLT